LEYSKVTALKNLGDGIFQGPPREALPPPVRLQAAMSRAQLQPSTRMPGAAGIAPQAPWEGEGILRTFSRKNNRVPAGCQVVERPIPINGLYFELC
jgi:hypothetical protein